MLSSDADEHMGACARIRRDEGVRGIEAYTRGGTHFPASGWCSGFVSSERGVRQQTKSSRPWSALQSSSTRSSDATAQKSHGIANCGMSCVDRHRRSRRCANVPSVARFTFPCTCGKRTWVAQLGCGEAPARRFQVAAADHAARAEATSIATISADADEHATGCRASEHVHDGRRYADANGK